MVNAQMDNAVNIAARTTGPEPVPGTTAQATEPDSEASGADFFWHLLDVINPLQHIPVVSTIYRALTGDEISPAAKLAGGTLYGGPVGAAAAVASIAIEEATGRDVGEHLVAAITGDDQPPADIQQAQAPVPAQTPVPAQAPGPAQAQAAIAPPPQEVVAKISALPAQEANVETIIWNGVRQLPIPAPATTTAKAGQQSKLEDSGAEDEAGAITVSASTADSAPWLATALSQAETLEAANIAGDTSVRPEAQPWVADAMMQALDQYDALAKQRKKEAEQGFQP